ncbi:hypothetical protein J0H58_14710 [bacterium]|nr:hypothetical protein [bacterium]
MGPPRLESEASASGGAKAHISRCLAAVKGGNTVIVTDRGKPVARIDPISPAEDPNVVLEVLVATGLARPATHLLTDDLFNSPRPKDPDGEVLKALPAERRLNRY